MIEAVELKKYENEELQEGFSGTSNDVRVFDQNIEDGMAFMFTSAKPKVFPMQIAGSNNIAQYCLVHVWQKDESGAWKQVMEIDAEGNEVPSCRRWFPGPCQRALTSLIVDENDTEKQVAVGPRVKASGSFADLVQRHSNINDAIADVYRNSVVDGNVQQLITVSYPENKRIWTRNPNYTPGGTQPKHRQQNIGEFNLVSL